MSHYGLLLDGALAVLLLVAIIYCMRLDGKLKSLRSGKDGMLQAAQELQSAVTDAQSAIAMLRQTSNEASRDLQRRIDEARAVAQQPPPKPASDFALRRRTAF